MTDLVKQAIIAQKQAYAPYSKRPQGAVLRLADGRLYAGATVENAGFVHGLEALESAIGLAVAGGAAIDIVEAVLCCAAEEDFPPLPLGLSLLSCFSRPEAILHVVTPDGTPLSTFKINDIAASPLDGSEGRPAGRAYPEGPLAKLFSVRQNAFCPVSHYAVGAMVETTTGEIFYGCNCEMAGNKSLHAEGVAIAGMIVALGAQARIRRVSVLTEGNLGFPCGGCRQHINEFAIPETEIVVFNTNGERDMVLHSDLLPRSFGNADIESSRL